MAGIRVATLGLLLLCLTSPAVRAEHKSPITRHLVENQPDVCPCCRVQCLKPWSVPDRWDDGGAPGHPEWAGNGRWDHEPFEDTNQNRLHDAGEPFTDSNGNQIYEEEFYHPFLTGYVYWKDGGLPIVLKPGSATDVSVAGQYHALDFSGDERQDPTGNRYEWDIRECNLVVYGPGDEIRLHPGFLGGPTQKGVEALIARDPGAYWDPATLQVISADPRTPRVCFIAFSDPRIEITPGRQTIRISKVAAFFIEGIDADGDLIGRFIKVSSPGILCPGDDPKEAAFISACPE